MGAAAQARGDRLIRAQIDRELADKSPVERAYALGLAEGRRQATMEVARLESELRRARSAFRRMQGYLSAERKRCHAIIEALEHFRERFRGKGPSGAAWAAIVALKRAKEAA